MKAPKVESEETVLLTQEDLERFQDTWNEAIGMLGQLAQGAHDSQALTLCATIGLVVELRAMVRENRDTLAGVRRRLEAYGEADGDVAEGGAA